jgi:hypothetical protein
VRTLHGGVAPVACVVEDEGQERGTGLGKQQVGGLADGIACALSGRRANTAEWQAVLPRRHVDDKSKERYLSSAACQSPAFAAEGHARIYSGDG